MKKTITAALTCAILLVSGAAALANRPAILDDFIELVQIDAVSFHERDVAEAVKAKMAEFGVELIEDDAAERIGGDCGNLFGVMEGGLPGSILFNAHLDRVANGMGIHPVVEDGLVRSDGTTILAADDIAGVAALIDCARRLHNRKTPFPRIEFLFTVAEDAGLRGSQAFDTSKLKSKIGYTFDSPGRLGRIINAAPGFVSLCIDVHGVAAHAGNCPENGVNAVTALAKILATIREGRLDSVSTANFAVLDCGTKATNIVQSRATCLGEMRSRNPQTITDYIAYFKRHCQEAVAGTGAEVETHATILMNSFNIVPTDPVVQVATDALRHMGIEPLVNGGGGGLDANNWNAAGITVVGVATGYSENHSVSEQVVLEDLLRSGELGEKIVDLWAERFQSEIH